MKVRLSGRGSRIVRALPRAAEQVRALLASAVELDATYEMTQGNPGERAFYELALGKGYAEFGGASWPFEGSLDDAGEVLLRDGDSGVFLLDDGTLVHAHAAHGWFGIHVSAPTREQTSAAVAAFAELYPATYRQESDANEVPITFWTYGQFGPQSRLRMIDAATWEEIEGNYSSGVREQLGALMDGFEPGKSGQLLLWQGPPGTGKTWALRALASEWRDWAEFNYITDPDAFFVTNPDYLVDVLLHDSYEELAVIDEEEELVTTDRLGKWRVLILEDTGELLAANAKESYGQGLSRLLNVVDGLVGQGLRILVLVTTNDELGELHPAVKRPGRCASQIEFDALSAADASEWLGEEVEDGGTLAELYARRGEGEDALAEEVEPEPVAAAAFKAVDKNTGGAMVALYPTPPQANALAIKGGQPAEDLHVTLVYLGDAADVDLAKVEDALSGAALGKPLAGESGEVFQFPEGDDGTPLNVAPDVPGLHELRAEVLRLLNAAGIEDASSFDEWKPHVCLGYDNDPAEAQDKVGLPLSFDSVAVVVGGERTNVPLTASASPAERWDRIVREVEDDEPEPVLASLEQTAAPEETFAMLRLAAAEVEAARVRESIVANEYQERERGILREVLGAMRALAIKPNGDTHVTIPSTEIHPHVTVHEPSITVEPSPAPDVHVQVEPPSVTVEAAAPAPPPDVRVTVEAPAQERPRAIRAVKDEDGTTTFEVVEDE